MRLLFTIAARAQTTACQLFRASHSGLQTPARNCRFVVVRPHGIAASFHDQHDIRSHESLARDQNIIPRRPQSSHYHHRLSQHSPNSKRPIVSVNAASPPHAGSCDKQRISHYHHVQQEKELFACLRRPLSVFLSSSFASTENRISNTTPTYDTRTRQRTPRPTA